MYITLLIKVTSELYPAVATSEDVEPVNLWIIIGAVSGGVVLLIIIGVVLWKVCYVFLHNYVERLKTPWLISKAVNLRTEYTMITINIS